MASTMVLSIVNEVSNVKKTFATRSMVSSGGNAALQQSFGCALMKQINMLKTMSPDEATALIGSLQDGPYGAEVTEMIMTVIDAKMKPPPTLTHAKNTQKCGTPSQALKAWWAYQTQEDWVSTGNPRSSSVPR